MNQPNQSDITCANCTSDTSMRYDYSQGIVVCQSCGLIATSRFIDQTSEYRVFSSENNNSNINPSRAGGAYIEQQASSGGLGTYFDDKNPLSKNIPHQHQLTCTDRQERNNDQWVKQIENWGKSLKLQDQVIKLAKAKFGELKTSEIKMGSEFAAAMALRWACRQKKCVLLDNAFENITKFDEESLWKLESKIKKNNVDRKIKEEEKKTNHHDTFEENKENKKSNDDGAKEWVPTTIKPSVYVLNFGKQLELPLVKKMEAFAIKLEESGVLDGKKPQTIAGVAMFAMGKGSLTMDQVSSLCKIATQTLKATFNSLISRLKSSKDEREKIILKSLID